MVRLSEQQSGLLAIITVLCLLAGCSEPNKLGRKALSGQVSFEGAPLNHGLIEFAPKDPNGVSTGATITGGEYSIVEHQGVPPGEYTVRITSPTESDDAGEESEDDLQPPGPQEGGPRQPPPARERIPPNYNRRSDQVVTVTEEGPNQFDFDIPGRK